MIYRKIQPEDKPAVITLLRESFGGWHGESSEMYWDWKFEQNPHGEARIWVCDDGGTMVGCYIMNPVRLHFAGTDFTGAQSVDAAVHPNHQGRGIFTSLVRTALQAAATDGIDLVFAFPSEGAYGGQVRSSFRAEFPVPKMYRPLPGWPSLRHQASDSVVAGTLNSFDSRFDAFADRDNAGEVTPQRDAGYLQWRYNEHPVKTYETLVCEHEGEICGYAVLTVDASRRSSPGYIVDFQVLPEYESAAGYLLSQVLRRFRSLGARVAVSWARSDGIEQRAMKASGFSSRFVSARRRIERPTYIDQFIVFDVGTIPALAMPELRWSLVPGDADYA